MHMLTTLVPILGLSTGLAHAASYTLEDDFGMGSSFFDKFDFYTSTDPTHGFVKYVDRTTANTDGLISSTNSSTYMGVDYKNAATSGRESVRITSKKSYTHGLFVLDLAHMPGGVCGTWPAYWLLGSDWPSNGEVDIIEGVHDQTNNAMAGHTSDGCSINNSGFTGSLSTSNCYVSAAGQSTNAGCSISDASSQSYGSGFNAASGGVYATEWTSDAISIWFFPRGSIPLDLTNGTPDPSTWSEPSARFAGQCDIDAHFRAMQIVFDTTFCGDWAGAVWSTTGCASKASSCDAYVANNPSAFRDAYWSINSLKVYQQGSSAKRAFPATSKPSGFVKIHQHARHGHVA
ncbi:putative endo-1,3(4)-beta-glucanase [Aspergillus ambiguus]|uniref:glycoside hydrolase family 16 protein n=1 Tax=Aspergillus ambiguus TaxID=176160 RepID=UPI003CCCFC36